MKKILFLILSVFLTTLLIADVHPFRKEILIYQNKLDVYKNLNEVLSEITTESQKFNKQGYKFYTKKEWNHALYFYQQAITADKDNAFAYYNYACTLALKFGKNADIDVMQKLISCLIEANSLNPYWGIKSLTDSDFDAIREIEGTHKVYWGGADCRPSTHFFFKGNGKIFVEWIWDSTSYMGDPLTDEDPSDYKEEKTEEGYYCYFNEYKVEYYPNSDPWIDIINDAVYFTPFDNEFIPKEVKSIHSSKFQNS